MDGQQSSTSPQQNPMSQMMPMIVMLILYMVFIFANEIIGEGLNYVLYPVIGFGGKMPLMTLFTAAMIFPVISRFVMFLTTDYVGRAKNAHINKHFQKELREAIGSNNKYKTKKLREMQPEIQQMQSSGMSMTSMIIPMLVVFPIFMWLRYFFGNLAVMPIAALPWTYVDLFATGTIPLGILAFPNWIIIYSIITFPLYLVLEKGLKLIFWSREEANSSHASRDSW